MNYLRYFGGKDVAVTACLAGAGAFGRSLLGRAATLPWLDIPIVLDRDAEVTARLRERRRAPRPDRALRDYGRCPSCLGARQVRRGVLARDVLAGEHIRLGDIEMDTASPPFRMRRAQDTLFAKAGATA
jgi:predicted homoserine dehydrogenase-like protein